MPSSFYSRINSEIEEVGWDNLVRLDEDLSCLSFRTSDKTGRSHTLEIQFKETYPKTPPSVSAAVPYMFNIQWSTKSRLKDVVLQFEKHLEKLEEVWSVLDTIDHSLWVVSPKCARDAMTHRVINIGDECFLKLFIDAENPRSFPECRVLGPDAKVDLLRKAWKRNGKRWYGAKPLIWNKCLRMSKRMTSTLSAAFAMRSVFPLMTNLEKKVEVGLIIHATTVLAVGLFTAFVLGTGCVQSPPRDSHLTSYLGIVPTVQGQLQLKSTLESSL